MDTFYKNFSRVLEYSCFVREDFASGVLQILVVVNPAGATASIP